jgi:hypothetical protein
LHLILKRLKLRIISDLVEANKGKMQ